MEKEKNEEGTYSAYSGNNNTKKKGDKSSTENSDTKNEQVPDQPLAKINNGEYQRR